MDFFIRLLQNTNRFVDKAMPANLIQKKKDRLTKWIQSETDEELIDFLGEIKKQREKNDWWEKLTITEKKIIQKGLKDADSGKIISSDDFWNSLKNA